MPRRWWQGAAALVWQAFPYFNNDLVRQTILGTATDIGEVGPDVVFGYGLLNVGAAVKGPGRFDWGNVLIEFDNKRAWIRQTAWTQAYSATPSAVPVA